jgi:hypothetical protein
MKPKAVTKPSSNTKNTVAISTLRREIGRVRIPTNILGCTDVRKGITRFSA